MDGGDTRITTYTKGYITVNQRTWLSVGSPRQAKLTHDHDSVRNDWTLSEMFANDECECAFGISLTCSAQ